MSFYSPTAILAPDPTMSGPTWRVCLGTHPPLPTRARHCSSDPTDAQWEVLAALLPWPVRLYGVDRRPGDTGAAPAVPGDGARTAGG